VTIDELGLALFSLRLGLSENTLVPSGQRRGREACERGDDDSTKRAEHRDQRRVHLAPPVGRQLGTERPPMAAQPGGVYHRHRPKKVWRPQWTAASVVASLGSIVAAPFSMVLLAAFLTAVGALQTAPILIAVLTAFLTMEGIKYLLTRRQHTGAAAGDGKPPPGRPTDA
jgi:hypothetical protein